MILPVFSLTGECTPGSGSLCPLLSMVKKFYKSKHITTYVSVIGKLIKKFKNYEDSERSECDEVIVNVDWFIIPLINPDGYEFSHTQDRWWRKNRRPPPPGSGCYGVDINRNFELGYGLGASTNPCEEVYQGPEAMSEPETRALATLSSRLNTSLLYYISLHAYGQSWLTPWGYKTDPVHNMEQLISVAEEAFRQMECVHGRVPAREYEVGGAADIYYVAGGASDDWVYERTGADYAYTVELPDDGREHGFKFPAEKLPLLADELWTMLVSVTINILATL